MADITLGDPAPNFYLPSVDGSNFLFETQRKHYEESWHLIVFFRGSWCPVCIETLKELEVYHAELHKNDIQVTAISAEPLNKLKRMKEKENLTFPVLSDEFFSVLDAFGVYIHKTGAPYEDHGAHGEPAYFLFNKGGTLMYQQKQTGPFGRPSPEAILQTAALIRSHMKTTPQKEESG
ncbi:peroxiredoxin family protein [Halobacillus sp. ACCC02827]|uniref:peroxiredoxin family protein n=1 Tax=Halobacillus sp. ACCC02827 TaxID=3052090 RepID=UPI0025712B97|nr:peroxiredoxin family protein [Halobacillus sp. ACCC02827]WJE14205.1 peroxiredoxin family protein [Halobacillus sp. ACCC02827]